MLVLKNLLIFFCKRHLPSINSRGSNRREIVNFHLVTHMMSFYLNSMRMISRRLFIENCVKNGNCGFYRTMVINCQILSAVALVIHIFNCLHPLHLRKKELTSETIQKILRNPKHNPPVTVLSLQTVINLPRPPPNRH